MSRNVQRELFISLEGIDASGKGANVPLIAATLGADGREIVRVREPGGTRFGEKLRQTLLNDHMDARNELMLMFACRRQLLAEVIEPALARGATVIADRFHDSSYAFQGARGIPEDAIKALDDWCGGPRPSVTFLFDIPVAIAHARIVATRVPDRFESEKEDFHEAARQIYLRRVANDPSRFRVINAALPRDQVSRVVEGYAAEIFKASRATPA